MIYGSALRRLIASDQQIVGVCPGSWKKIRFDTGIELELGFLVPEN
ncbi:MAG: hypothetical protein HQM08_22120 [Candidatus Riflebacteria bacterium]|nr:hypothetical protein [Candidatus Riflebacteria bacterium]